MADELPGANIFALALQAPADMMSLATRQATETMSLFSMGIQTLGAELATPPSMAGLALPPLPGMPQTAAPATQMNQTSAFASYRKPKLAGM